LTKEFGLCLNVSTSLTSELLLDFSVCNDLYIWQSYLNIYAFIILHQVVWYSCEISLLSCDKDRTTEETEVWLYTEIVGIRKYPWTAVLT